MKLYELMQDIEFQSEVTICRYNYKTDALETLTEEEGANLEVKYIYTNPEIHIEVEGIED